MALVLLVRKLFLLGIKHIAVRVHLEHIALFLSPKERVPHALQANSLQVMEVPRALCAPRTSTLIQPDYLLVLNALSLLTLFPMAQLLFWIARYKPVPLGKMFLTSMEFTTFLTQEPACDSGMLKIIVSP
jgi:hypothetical protein